MATSGRWFRFADFFAGIGGFRIGLEKLGGKCVFSSEWDRYSQKTYECWFGETPHGDIREIARHPEAIPDFDLLAAGFPCQPFSIAGVSKRGSLGWRTVLSAVPRAISFSNSAPSSKRSARALSFSKTSKT